MVRCTHICTLSRVGGSEVQQTTFSEFRRHAKDFFDAVEEGDVVRVYRNGRPIADVVPIPAVEPAWKRPVPRVSVRGLQASSLVIRGRVEQISPDDPRESPLESGGECD